MEMDGHTITSSCLMFGFSLFGKNLLNIWAILFGVYLYSHYHKTHLSRYVYIGFYGTSLSPIITQIMYISHLPYAIRLITSLAVGLMIGFVLPPLSTHVHYAHKGYSLQCRIFRRNHRHRRGLRAEVLRHHHRVPPDLVRGAITSCCLRSSAGCLPP